MKKEIRKQAKSRGISITHIKGGKRKYKSEDELLKQIVKHDSNIVNKRANQTKNMLMTCKSIMALVNKQMVGVGGPPPPPPPPPPPMKKMGGPPPPPPPPPPPMKKLNSKGINVRAALLNELRAFQKKKALKNKNKNNST